MYNFLLCIGIYNVFGAVILMLLISEKLSDKILRKFTEIISEPYSHGPFGKLWLWWAATSNLFLGLIMILSTRWDKMAQREVIFLVLITYILMYFALLVGGRKPKYGRGIYFTHVLWIVQIAWGVWAILK